MVLLLSLRKVENGERRVKSEEWPSEQSGGHFSLYQSLKVPTSHLLFFVLVIKVKSGKQILLAGIGDATPLHIELVVPGGEEGEAGVLLL
jgi:hypothetical protein